MKFFPAACLAILLIYLSGFANHANGSSISLPQMVEDVQTLADDKFAGRRAFTAEIDLAADYIAERFSQIGLAPLNGNQGFKQTFTIFQINQVPVKCQLDDENIDNNNVFVLSAHQKLIWNKSKERRIELINAEQDFRQTMTVLNRINEDILVLVDPIHKDLFQRYQEYFARGMTKFKENVGPSAVFIMTEKKALTSYDIHVNASIETQQLTNVVGVIPGKQQIDEKIIFSAHYDHLGTNPELTGDTIFNGADDDATGTTAVIHLAEYYSKQKNIQRSLIFVAFTAEEIGGFGSQYFSSQLSADSITAMINIEMIGKPSRFGAGKVWMTGNDRSNLAEILNDSLPDSKIYADPYPEQHLFYRSDNATLARLGVPAHSFSSSQIDIDEHYHKVSDDFSTIDLESMHQVIDTLAKATRDIVEGKVSPTRVDTSEVIPKGIFY